jgi:16S rRNA pseudouridine516 synthase
MQSKTARLDRFLSSRAGISRRDVRPILAQGRVTVDGAIATRINQVIGEFTHVLLDNEVLQARLPVYIMLHKPTGVVSATRDERHKTVIDLLDHEDKSGLHIAGRLDLNASGLLLLTNDGRWSRRLSSPQCNVGKLYRVTLEKSITVDYVEAFAEGMYFAYEGITTRPAILRIIDDHHAEVTLVEGRYHQIKRMFGHFQNRVLQLHRIAIGNLPLDSTLDAGQSRELTALEVDSM